MLDTIYANTVDIYSSATESVEDYPRGSVAVVAYIMSPMIIVKGGINFFPFVRSVSFSSNHLMRV